MATSCGWPFHSDPKCEECAKWESKYGENLTEWLDQKKEIRAAALVARRKTMQAGVNAQEQQGSG